MITLPSPVADVEPTAAAASVPAAPPPAAAPDEAEEVSIADVGRSIAASRDDFTGEVVFDTSKSDGQFKKTASNAKLRSHLPDFKFTPFADGIKKTVQWFFENYDSARK